MFIKFSRSLSDPRTDGNSQAVYFRRYESFEFVVRQGAEAAPEATDPPPLQPDEILLVDAKRTYGQKQIFNADLSPNPIVPGDLGRRQTFVFVEAASIGAVTGMFNALEPATDDVQAVLDEVDTKLTEHFARSTGRHSATDVDAAAESGSPNSLTAGTVRTQLNQLLGHINNHENTTGNAQPNAFARFIFRFILPLMPSSRSPEQGSEKTIYAATSPELEGVSGKFLMDCAERRSSDDSYDRENAERWWKTASSFCGIASSDEEADGTMSTAIDRS